MPPPASPLAAEDAMARHSEILLLPAGIPAAEDLQTFIQS
jgi:hypothetical protein